MGRSLFHILHEDPRLLAVAKPSGLVCHPTKGDVYSSLISRLRLYLGPDARPHLINRLDRETGGVLLAAKDPETARDLRRLWEAGEAMKEYLAIVHGHVKRDFGAIEAPLGKDETSEVAIKDCVRPDGAPSRTEYQVLARFNQKNELYSLLKIHPLTGRKHQIRIHLAHLGHPVVGDKMYGLDPGAYLAFVRDQLSEAQRRVLVLPWQALHAAGLSFRWMDREWIFKSEPEFWFKNFLPFADIAEMEHERPGFWKAVDPSKNPQKN